MLIYLSNLIHSQERNHFSLQTGLNASIVNLYINGEPGYFVRNGPSYRPGGMIGARYNFQFSDNISAFTGLNVALHIWKTPFDRITYDLNNHYIVYTGLPLGVYYKFTSLRKKCGIGIAFSTRIKTFENTYGDGFRVHSHTVKPPNKGSLVTGFGEFFTTYPLNETMDLEFSFSHALTHFFTATTLDGRIWASRMNYFTISLNYKL